MSSSSTARMKLAREYEQDIAASIENCNGFWEWLKENRMEIAYSRLFGDNREKFREIFGFPNFYFRGEFFFHVWKFDHEGEVFYVLSAKNKGTCIEVVADAISVQFKSAACISFVQMLLDKIVSQNTGEKT